MTEDAPKQPVEAGGPGPEESGQGPDELRSGSADGEGPGPSVLGSKPKSLLVNAGWNVACTMLLMAVALFMAPFLIHRIGDDRYGLYMLVFKIIGVLDIMNLGLAEATLRYVAHYYGRGDLAGIHRVIGSTLTVYLITGLGAATALFLAAPFIAGYIKVPAGDEGLAVNVLRLAGMNFVFLFLSAVFQSIPQALRRYDISGGTRILQSLCYVAGSVVIVLLGGNVLGLTVWCVVTSIFTLVVAAARAKQLLPSISLRPDPSLSGLREIFGFGFYMFIAMVFSMAWNYTDSLLLGFLVSTGAVAYLTVPQNIGSRVHRMALESGWVLFPRTSAMTSEEEMRKLYVGSVWTLLVLTAVMFVPMVVLIPDFLRLWISPEFAGKSAFVGQLVTASLVAAGAFVPHNAVLRGLGKGKIVAKLAASGSVIAVGINVVLISKYGLSGAGYASFVLPVWGLVGLVVTWRAVLGMKETWPLVRVVGVPAGLAYGSLVLFLWARTAFSGTIGWVGLFAWAGTMLAVTGGLLVAAEWLLGGAGSQLRVVLEYGANLWARRRSRLNAAQGNS
jgi:O-antigen/teichoic acid export membrane protein